MLMPWSNLVSPIILKKRLGGWELSHIQFRMLAVVFLIGFRARKSRIYHHSEIMYVTLKWMQRCDVIIYDVTCVTFYWWHIWLFEFQCWGNLIFVEFLDFKIPRMIPRPKESLARIISRIIFIQKNKWVNSYGLCNLLFFNVILGTDSSICH